MTDLNFIKILKDICNFRLTHLDLEFRLEVDLELGE